MTETRHPSRQSREAESPLSPPLWVAVSRGVAVFLGLFLLIDLLFVRAESLWWSDSLPPLSPLLRGILSYYAMALLIFGFAARVPKLVKGSAMLLTVGLMTLLLLETARWYESVRAGTILSPVRVPFQLQMISLLAVILVGVVQRDDPRRGHQRGVLLGVVAFDLCLVMIPLAHLYTSGQTTHSGTADALIVFVEGHEPSDVALSRIERLLNSDGAGEIVLVGARESAEHWQVRLLPRLATSGIEILAVRSLDEPVVKTRPWSSVVLIGDAYQIAPIAVRWQRQGQRVGQVVTSDRPVDLRSATRSIPHLWIEYLRGGGSSEPAALPTAAVR